MTEYVCRSCHRVVDPDDEPSPGEPRHCPDCHTHNERDDQIMREALGAWGTGGVA